MTLLGVADDIWDLDWLTKLVGQVLAAGLMAWWGGVQLYALPIGGSLTIPSSRLSLFATVLVVVVAINAVNFVDGLDGLAAGVTAIGGSAFLLYTYLLTRNISADYANVASVVIAVVVGACVGFLPHNLNPARIFMGDSGSMLIGLTFAAAGIVVTGQVDATTLTARQQVPAFLPILLPVAVLLLPLLDMGLAVVRRMGRGKSPFHPDRAAPAPPDAPARPHPPPGGRDPVPVDGGVRVRRGVARRVEHHPGARGDRGRHAGRARPDPRTVARPGPAPGRDGRNLMTVQPPGSADAVRAVLRRALRHLLWLLAALAVAGSAFGWFVAGAAGVWGALIGVGVALVFSGTTVLAHLRTADAPVTTTGAVILGSWLAKMALLVVLLAVLDGLTFYDRTVLVAVLVVGVVGSVYLDYLAVTSGRVPYVDPAPRQDPPAEP